MPDRIEHQQIWQSCSVNCGSHCALRYQIKDERIRWVETDNDTCDDIPQMRACLRGRAMRYWLESPDRLNYPMKRIGPRGSGEFVRIDWDEALDIVASRIREVTDTWGNEAVLLPYGTGLFPGSGSPFERLMNCYGGFLEVYGDYSCAQLQSAMTYLYGDDGYYSGSVLSEAAKADLVVLFGSNPPETRMGGASASYELTLARERGDFKLVSIDPRHTDVITREGDQWIPIRPGTDAAFVAGCAYVLITEDRIDEDFLNKYCVGYDASTMPPSAPLNANYKDYILGTGADGIQKTPQWAAQITGVPASKIESFARELGSARRAFIAQGWGPQRCEFGEQTARAICMLSLLTGNFGLSGTNAGMRERFLPFVVPQEPVGENAVNARIPAFMWLEAIRDAESMTALNAGVRGAEKLVSPVKMIINHGGNCLTNQHADINATHDVLVDESLCEFILVVDVMMTDSAKYADILLPDLARAEQSNIVSSGSADMQRSLIHGGSFAHQTYERRSAWSMAADLASRLGIRQAFDAAGTSQIEVDQARLSSASGIEALIGTSHLRKDAERQTGEGIDDAGWLLRNPYEGETIAYRLFREDPDACPLNTPSGKVEIYSERLAEYAAKSGLPISPIPEYIPAEEGYGSNLQRDYPFQLIGYHGKQSTHSSFANIGVLQELVPRRLLMNPIDATQRGFSGGQIVVVENGRGSILSKIRVTPRVMPGVLALPQGAWHDAEMTENRLDVGGCINTLTSALPSALAKGNAHNSCLVRVRKLTDSERAEVKGRVGQQ